VKEKGNTLFAQGQHEAALAAFSQAIEMGTPLCMSENAVNERVMCVLHSNRAACFLAMGGAVHAALSDARFAVALDSTFEKAWLRLGMALEAVPGSREDAVTAYRRIPSNAIAAKRIAVLQALLAEAPKTPTVVVTTDGLTGVPEGSLDPRVMAVFPDPSDSTRTACICRASLSGRWNCATTVTTTAFRLLMKELTHLVWSRYRSEVQGGLSVSRHVLRNPKRPNEEVWFDLMGDIVTLSGVADDGRSRMVSYNSSEVPLMLVQLHKGKPPSIPGLGPNVWSTEQYAVDLQRFKAMLVRNSALLSKVAKLDDPKDGSCLSSVLTHVAVPELDYSVHEGCSFPGCTVESAPNRCGRCFLARYCSEEHLTADWKQHKLQCVPHAERQPAAQFGGMIHYYRDNEKTARLADYDCIPVPQRTFPGLVVVKILLLPNGYMKMCDPHGVFSINTADGELEEWKRMFLCTARMYQRYGVGYYDADMSVEDRVVVYMDRCWKCTW
jgi:hypothetical protein